MKIASQTLIGLRVYSIHNDTRVTCIRCSKDSEYYERDDTIEIHSYELEDELEDEDSVCCDRCGVDLLETVEEECNE